MTSQELIAGLKEFLDRQPTLRNGAKGFIAFEMLLNKAGYNIEAEQLGISGTRISFMPIPQDKRPL